MRGAYVAMRLEKLSKGVKSDLLTGEADQGWRTKCSDLDRRERPSDGKQKGWIMEDGEGIEM